ncbi:hypothetical protein TNCV_3725561 [Trichonephila clavipes]|nr:hypothetical protein TNCV_3725561 [Trichonephila clavipes]
MKIDRHGPGSNPQMGAEGQRQTNYASMLDIQIRTLRRLRSDASQHLTSLYPHDRGVTSAVSMPISGIKVHLVRGNQNQ